MTASRLVSRAVIRLSPGDEGEDAGEFLQGLVTNDVTGELPVWAALLSPQGKVLFDFIVWPGEARSLLIDCEASAAENLVKRLSMYRLRRKITIAVDDQLAVHWRAPGGDGAAPDARPDPRFRSLGQRWLAPAESAEAEAADDEWQSHRLSLGVTEGTAELGSDQTLWLECNAAELNGVSFSKGCYIGQENTARMNWRQKVNRRLIVVPLEQSDPKRQRIAYPELGLAVDHRRIDDIGPSLAPEWMVLTDNAEADGAGMGGAPD